MKYTPEEFERFAQIWTNESTRRFINEISIFGALDNGHDRAAFTIWWDKNKATFAFDRPTAEKIFNWFKEKQPNDNDPNPN